MKWKDLHKIAVSGSRKFKYCDLATQWLDKYIRTKYGDIDNVVIITGGAIGIDAAMERLCLRRGIKNLVVHGRWVELDHAAGPIRNKHIVQLANEVIAFWDGISKGTGGTIKYAQKINKPIKIFGHKKLKKVMHVTTPLLRVPRTASKRDAHSLRALAKDANVKELLYDPTRNVKKVQSIFEE